MPRFERSIRQDIKVVSELAKPKRKQMEALQTLYQNTLKDELHRIRMAWHAQNKSIRTANAARLTVRIKSYRSRHDTA
jgi:hypothetical protein